MREIDGWPCTLRPDPQGSQMECDQGTGASGPGGLLGQAAAWRSCRRATQSCSHTAGLLNAGLGSCLRGSLRGGGLAHAVLTFSDAERRRVSPDRWRVESCTPRGGDALANRRRRRGAGCRRSARGLAAGSSPPRARASSRHASRFASEAPPTPTISFRRHMRIAPFSAWRWQDRALGLVAPRRSPARVGASTGSFCARLHPASLTPSVDAKRAAAE